MGCGGDGLPRSYEALQPLAKALRDERERIVCGAAGREVVWSRDTWAAIARELEQFYHSILDESTE